MRLVDYLAKGASLVVDRPCLTMDGLHLPVRAGTAARRRCAGRKDRRYFRQQPVFIRLRAGYFAGGRGVVPESAVRGGGERLSAGAVRLRLHFFPERVWSAGAAELAGAAEGQAHRMTRCRSRERALPAGLAGRPAELRHHGVEPAARRRHQRPAAGRTIWRRSPAPGGRPASPRA